MRQVNRDELANILQAGMRGWTKETYRRLQHRNPTEQLRMRVACGTMLADKLSRFEILVDAPEPPPFHYADLDGGSGVPMRDDVPVGKSDF